MAAEPDSMWQLRAQIRKNITETLVSLRVNTVDDIQQIAAVLAQCTVGQGLGPSATLGLPTLRVGRPCALPGQAQCEPQMPPG